MRNGKTIFKSESDLRTLIHKFFSVMGGIRQAHVPGESKLRSQIGAVGGGRVGVGSLMFCRLGRLNVGSMVSFRSSEVRMEYEHFTEIGYKEYLNVGGDAQRSEYLAEGIL